MKSHLAILKKKYLDLILSGDKTLECRLTKIACTPYENAGSGQTILLKFSGGPLIAQARIDKVRFFKDLTPERIRAIHRKYNHLIQAEDDFYRQRSNSRFGTLIWLKDVREIEPIRIIRKGMQAWLTFEQANPLELLRNSAGTVVK